MRTICSLLTILCIGCGGTAVTSTDEKPGTQQPARPMLRTVTAIADRANSSGGGDGQNNDPTTPPPSVDSSGGDNTTAPPVATPAPTPAPTTVAEHTRCGWLDGDDASNASFVANAARFNAIHPKWYQVDPTGAVIPVSTPDLPAIVNAAHANHVKLMPMIDNPDAARLRIILSSPAKIAAHVQTLLALVQQHGYDGMDFDYEHLWSKSDRPGFLSLMTQMAAAFHAHGYQLSMAVGAFATDDGNNAYDYQTLSDNLDVMHLMFYDYHYPAGDHMGPIAPLGWVDGTLQHTQSTGNGGKFIVGLANYAIGIGWYDWLKTGMSLCIASIDAQTDEMESCPYNDQHFTAGTAPHCLTKSQGTIWFENLVSMEEKLQLAQKYGARGVTYWVIGNEIDGLFDLMQKYYP